LCYTRVPKSAPFLVSNLDFCVEQMRQVFRLYEGQRRLTSFLGIGVRPITDNSRSLFTYLTKLARHKVCATSQGRIAMTTNQARTLRAARKGNYYHIVLRGNGREALFATAQDRRTLNAIATEALRRFRATLHGYCLLPNQFRFLVHIDDRVLLRAVRTLVTRYTRYKQAHSDRGQTDKAYGKTDAFKDPASSKQLFERPYHVQRIQTEREFLALLRRIHLSPVIANSAVTPADYRWSSHRAYLGFNSVAWINTEYGLSLLSADLTAARIAYPQFVNDGLTRGTAITEVQDAQEESALEATSPPTRKRELLTRKFRRNKEGSTKTFLSIY
jgi:REP element-mobilizing transposase RayT